MEALALKDVEALSRKNGFSLSGRRLVYNPPPHSQVVVRSSLTNIGMLCEQLTDWVFTEPELLLYFSDWNTDPAINLKIVEFFRKGIGIPEPLIDKPGMLFRNEAAAKLAVTTLIFMATTFDFQLFVLSFLSRNFLVIGDEALEFSAENAGKIKAARKIASKFDLDIVGIS